MEKLDEIFLEADRAGLRFTLASENVTSVRGDAVLFDAVQVPVVALTVVACIASNSRGEALNNLGARVGHTLMAAFPGFTRIGRYLQWSIRVRTVTADAIVFLEQSGLISVPTDRAKNVKLTVRGRDFLRTVRAGHEVKKLYGSLAQAAARTRNDDLRLL